MADDLDRVVNETGMGRRTFVRRLVTGTVFAAPVVASFAMGGIEAAQASPHSGIGSLFPFCNTNQTKVVGPAPAPIINQNQTYQPHGNADEFFEQEIYALERSICNPNQSGFGHLFP